MAILAQHCGGSGFKYCHQQLYTLFTFQDGIPAQLTNQNTATIAWIRLRQHAEGDLIGRRYSFTPLNHRQAVVLAGFYSVNQGDVLGL